MEAQRICLSLVYSAHVDQVREYLKAEKESALRSLKEELVHSHLQEMNDLKKMHQLELQALKIQQAGNDQNYRRKALGVKSSIFNRKKKHWNRKKKKKSIWGEVYGAVQQIIFIEYFEVVLCQIISLL